MEAEAPVALSVGETLGSRLKQECRERREGNSRSEERAWDMVIVVVRYEGRVEEMTARFLACKLSGWGHHALTFGNKSLYWRNKTGCLEEDGDNP